MSRKNIDRCVVPTRPSGVKNDHSNLSVIILAASPGYRMKSYGPKSLLKTSSGETVLQGQVSTIRSVYKNCEIVVVVGFGADSIIKKRPEECRIVENQLYEESGEVEQIRLAINNIYNKNVLIINGGVLFDKECIKEITKDESSLLIDTEQLPNEEIGATVVDDHITILSHALSEYKWGNIGFFTGKEFQMLQSFCDDRDKSKLYMFECINEMLNKKLTIKAYNPPNKSIIKINSSNDIADLKNN